MHYSFIPIKASHHLFKASDDAKWGYTNTNIMSPRIDNALMGIFRIERASTNVDL